MTDGLDGGNRRGGKGRQGNACKAERDIQNGRFLVQLFIKFQSDTPPTAIIIIKKIILLFLSYFFLSVPLLTSYVVSLFFLFLTLLYLNQ